MANLIEKQKESLTNFLRNVFTKDEDYFIQNSDGRMGKRFALARKTSSGAYEVLSNFMKYEEMNCYFFGMKLMKDNQVKF